MGIGLRRVPADWQHPTEWRKDFPFGKPDPNPLAYTPEQPGRRFRPLFDESWDRAMRIWWKGRIKETLTRLIWYVPSVLGWCEPPFAVCYRDDDPRPDAHYYRPKWSKHRATHLQLYETVSEGTPISPVCASIESLIDWCASQSRRVWVGTENMDRAAWERFFERGGWAMSMVATPERGIESGVQYMARGTGG